MRNANERTRGMTNKEVSAMQRKEANDRRIERQVKITKRIAVGVGIGVLALGAYKAMESDKLPMPEHTGNKVRIHFDDGQGANEVKRDLERPGYDASEFEKKLKKIEAPDGSIPSTVMDVDSGLLDQNKDLTEYGITHEDMHPQE
jgi:hypothetical protein